MLTMYKFSSDSHPTCHCGAPIDGDGMYGYYCKRCDCEYGELCERVVIGNE